MDLSTWVAAVNYIIITMTPLLPNTTLKKLNML